MRTAPIRSGAALIIALVVLAALLLLGLPFLFTQSSSLAGTRSFSHSQQALIGRASAENIGIAAAAAAMDWHWQLRIPPVPPAPPPPNQDEWTSLYWGLGGGTILTPEILPLAEGRTGVDLRIARKDSGGLPLDPIYADQTLAGVVISDEHGKLDPNHLDSSAWTRLLAHLQVNIADWDDGTVTPSDPTRNQLARALADLRFRRIPDLLPDGTPALWPDGTPVLVHLIPGGRITRLDQLLLAVPPPSARIRHGLTRAELAQVAPYLSLHGMAQARGGLIDFGTVVAQSGGQAIPDSVPPGSLLAHAVFPTLVGSGTVIVDADDNGRSPGVSQPDTRDNTLTSSGLTITGRALAIEAPPAVNLHEASDVVRKVLFDVPAAQPPAFATNTPRPSTLTELAPLGGPLALPTNASTERIDALERPRTPFDLLDPLGIVQEVITANTFGSRPDGIDVSLGMQALINPQSGVLETVVVVNGGANSALTVEASARQLHLIGSGLTRLPPSGYARLDGNAVPADPLTQAGTSAREYVFFSSSNSVAGGTTATLSGLARGKVMPPSGETTTPIRFFADGLKVTILAARELPPLAIASPGIVTVETAATATDPAGRQTAQQTRTVVAQTVAQENALEARWERQSHFHANLAQRQGSLMASFPTAVDRVQGDLPDEAVSPAAPPVVATDPYRDQRIGVRPAVLRAPLVGGHLNHEWTAPLAGRDDITNSRTHALRGGALGAQEMPPAYSVSDLFPEGLQLQSGRRLSWLFAPNGNNAVGFFRHGQITNGATLEILPAQVGFWVRPDASWATRTDPVILFEVRGPTNNAGLPLLGTAATTATAVADPRDTRGNTALQNYLGLSWNPNNEFVLAFGTGAIEHTLNYGPAVPSDNYAISTNTSESKSPAVDNASLGSDPTNYYPLAPARPMNRIEHRYRFDGASLRPGTWHMIQIAFSGTRPDHASIMVDGLVGRRVEDRAAATAQGDHYAMPRLRLAAALPATHQDFATRGAEVYRVDAITLTGPAAEVLPVRGMIRIGSEYISYQRLSGNTLLNCWRARRQDSISGSKPAITEAHAIGDEVYPGGYRTTVPTLYTGGNTLAGPLSNGDTRVGGPSPTPHPYRVWGAVTPPVPVDPLATTFAVPGSGNLSLPLYADALNDQFPSQGYILINNDELAFYTRDPALNPPLLQILEADRWLGPTSTPAQGTRPSAAAHDHNLSITSPSSTPITLVSAALAGPDDPTVAGKFAPASFSTPGLLQLYDANGTSATHRAEWVRYQDLITRSGVHYVLNYSGFDAGQRGQLRTAFAARDLGDTAFFFPAGTRVLPVQRGNRFAETGDVLTVALQQLSEGPDKQPWQSVVRFAEKDGWGSPNPMTGAIPTSDPVTGRPFDGSNNHFAFCEAAPERFTSPIHCHLLCWPGWNGERDLSSTIDLTANPDANRTDVATHDLLPWGNAWATSVLRDDSMPPAAPPDDRRIFFGADDDRTTHNASVSPATTMAIDALWSGSHWSAGNTSLSITSIISATPVDIELPWIAGTALSDASAVEVQANGSLFPTQGLRYVLALIGGEVFALEQRLDTGPMPNVYRPDQARIVGRALLGSAPRIHRGKEPVLILPIGPVTPLLSTLSPTDQGAAPFASLNAPAVMVMDADGSAAKPPEMLIAPNGHTAPWLRGMYGTPIGTWTVAGGTPPPLVVGWWPRYPSALPTIPGTTVWPAAQRDAWTNALFRSRSYAWAGFPLRFHDARFFAKPASSGLPGSTNDFPAGEVEVIDDGDGLYDLEARALPSGSFWSTATPVPLLVPVPPASATPFDIRQAFATPRFYREFNGTVSTSGRMTWKQFDPIPVDGAELRVTWSAPTSAATTMQEALLDLARHNRAPMIGPVRLRCRAPSQVLSVEAAR